MASDGSLKSKLKSLLGRKNSSSSSREQQQTAGAQSDSGDSLQRPPAHIEFSLQCITGISPAIARPQRYQNIQNLSRVIAERHLPSNAVHAITDAIKDLIDGSDLAGRHSALKLVLEIIQTQDDEMIKGYFFGAIQWFKYIESDHDLNVKILSSLIKHGLTHIDMQLGSLLVKWLRALPLSKDRSTILELTISVIKKNAAFLDEEHAIQLCSLCCTICNSTTSASEVPLCLKIFESLLRYYYIDSSQLPDICRTLCYTVLREEFASRAWKLMRELIGTHLGHATVFTLSRLLQHSNQTSLLRGAVFFLGMTLWGTQRVESLQINASSVLPGFLQALKYRSFPVGSEVSTMVLRLARKHGRTQPATAWENILEIIQILLQLISHRTLADSQIANKIAINVHDTLSTMENLRDESSKFTFSSEQLYKVIESCAENRQVKSVMRLVEYRAAACHPPKENWLEALNTLFESYYRGTIDSRIEVRLTVIEEFKSILKTNQIIYESELLDLMLSEFSNLDSETSIPLKQEILALISDVCRSCFSVDKCLSLLEIVYRVMIHSKHGDSADVADSARLLIALFRMKLIVPAGSEISVACLNHILDYLQYCYSSNSVNNETIRYELIQLLLQLRCDSVDHLGLSDSGRCVYSTMLFIEKKTHEGRFTEQTEHEQTTLKFNYYKYFRIANMLVLCINKETSWKVLHCVLQLLPNQLQNRPLVLSAGDTCIESICLSLCTLVQQKSIRSLTSLPAGFKKLDFHVGIYSVISCMSAYHQSLSQNAKIDVVTCLQHGLLSEETCRTCVHTLRVCCIEMESIMLKMLPSILGRLAKITAKKTTAVPLLMFLSCLVRLPRLYRSFNKDQYRFIFNAALPYTDPFRFPHFAVYLAYHVINMWFVKCRLNFRHEFVSAIIRGLDISVREHMNSKAHHQHHDSNDTKEDASERESLRFHEELKDTCVDLMSRYAYSECFSSPRRTPISEFLLSGGKSQCWFIGQKIITVTTNSSDKKDCPKCGSNKRLENTAAHGSTSCSVLPGQDKPPTTAGRRRHQSAAVKAACDLTNLTQSSFDDLALTQRTNTTNSTNFQNLQSASITGETCQCWVSGWAEVHIRSASGDVSWIMRTQNNVLIVPETHNPASGDMGMVYFSPLRTHPTNSTPLNSPFHLQSPLTTTSSSSNILRITPHTGEPVRTDYRRHIVPGPAIRRITLMDESDEINISTSPSRPAVRSSSMIGSSRPSVFVSRQTSMTDLEDCHTETTSTEAGTEDHFKHRSNTISGSADFHQKTHDIKSNSHSDGGFTHNATSHLFLQIYNSGVVDTSKPPVKIADSAKFLSSAGLKTFDRIQPYETHKVGVVYVGEGQEDNELAILANEYGSKRYTLFLQSLGQLVKLKADANSVKDDLFLGGLDRTKTAEDGKYTYMWFDDLVQMVFHITTMMPTVKSDKQSINKKRHIGNDFVTVVYNDSHHQYKLGTIRGKFNYVNIIIQPLDDETSQVSLVCKDEVHAILGHTSTKVISDKSLPQLVRQIALHSSMGSNIYERLGKNELFASNWLERLRKIKKLRHDHIKSAPQTPSKLFNDFTVYT